MEFEKLALEVSAIKAGLKEVTPHVLRGESGLDHRFDLLFTDGNRSFAFDFHDSVGVVEVVSSYAKKLDCGCSVSIVCPVESVSGDAARLALDYNMRILSPGAADTFFALERAAPRRAFG